MCEKIINTLNESHLHQLQRESTRKDAVLDHICTIKPRLEKNLKTIPGTSDHDGIILADMELKAQINKKPSRMVPIWSKADWGKLKEKAAAFTTEFLSKFEDQNLHENWKDLEDHMKHLKNSIPSKRTSTRHNLLWLTTEATRMCRKKRRIYKKAKRTRDDKDWYYYKHQNNTRKVVKYCEQLTETMSTTSYQVAWSPVTEIPSGAISSPSSKILWEWHHWGTADSSFQTLSLRLNY